jgi:hypothetical protein
MLVRPHRSGTRRTLSLSCTVLRPSRREPLTANLTLYENESVFVGMRDIVDHAVDAKVVVS